MKWVNGGLIVAGLLALAWVSMPYGLILIAAGVWFFTIDYRK